MLISGTYILNDKKSSSRINKEATKSYGQNWSQTSPCIEL